MVDCAQGGEDQEGPGHQQAGRDDDAEGLAGGKLRDTDISSTVSVSLSYLRCTQRLNDNALGNAQRVLETN